MENFNMIFERQFSTSQEAVDFCQFLSHRSGFSVRIRTSKATTVYLVCSREGTPEKEFDSIKSSKKRSRSSDRCNCNWKIVLYKNFSRKVNQWEFRAGKTSQHNHSLFVSEEYIPALTTKLSRNVYHPYNSSNSPNSYNQSEQNFRLPPINTFFSIASEAQSPPKSRFLQTVISNSSSQTLPGFEYLNSPSINTSPQNSDSSSSSPKLHPLNWDLKLPPLNSLYYTSTNFSTQTQH